MLKYLLQNYRIVYLMFVIWCSMLVYCNLRMPELKRDPKFKLLSLTETFASHPVPRSYWLWQQTICVAIFSTLGHELFSIYFNSVEYMGAIRDSKLST